MASSSHTAFLARIEVFIRDHDLLAPGQPVVVGMSGGVDSMALADVLLRLGCDVTAAHVNYGLRGTASDADEGAIRTWCAHQQPAIPLRVAHHDPEAKAAAEQLSVQEAAREQRYAFMTQCADAIGADRVAVGHHRGDQAETLLLNLFRGSGVEGLAGMAPRRPLAGHPTIELVRPFLGASRPAIEAYAEERELPWRTDRSNRAIKYDRNVIRHRVLPVIEAHFEGARERMAHAADLVRAYRTHTLAPALAVHFARCGTSTETGGTLDCAALRALPAVWRQRVILEAVKRWLPDAPYHAAFAEEVEHLVDAQVGRRIEAGAGTIWRERGLLRFVASARPPLVEARPVPFGEAVALPQGAIRVDRVDKRPDSLSAGAPGVVYADAQALSGPLTVRTWRDGDRFQPLGMTHSKKVSDFLTDEQVPPHQRRNVLVMEDQRRIVWVVGYRLAHPVRIRLATQKVVRMRFERTPKTE